MVGYVPGATDEYVIIGAHYDHLGLGEQYSLAPEKVGTIHPGADDNASGAAGVLALARYFASHPKPARGILFIAFAGEELGLLGSTHYVNHPCLPLNRAALMINMDMIGRIRDRKVMVGGAPEGSPFRRILETLGPQHDLDLDLSDTSVYGSSDHTSFKARQVPTLFFFSGLHADYHRPSDTWEKIDPDSTVRLLKLIADLTMIAGTPSGKPQFAYNIFQRFSTASTSTETSNDHTDHDAPRVRRLGERKVLEVHPVYSRDHKRRRSNRSKYGQNLHHLIGPVRHAREIQLSGSRQQVAMDLDQIKVANQVIVDVPQKRSEVLPDKWEFVSKQMAHDVARIGEQSPQLDQHSLQIEHVFEH